MNPSDDDRNDTAPDRHGRTDEEAGMPRLADLQATDALLDRLGGRSASDADLADPTVADLAALITFVDERALPDPRLQGLLGVLDGRPLYPIREDVRATVEEAEQPIDLTGVSVETGPTRIIDVSQEPAAQVGGPPVPAARSAQDVVSIAAARLRRMTRVNDEDDAPAWQRMLGKAAMPAAAVILAVGLGGGVTAAVTGNPMAPLDGISEVASQLPGMKPKADRQLESAQKDLAQAKEFWRLNKPQEAREALARAESKLKDVPPDKLNDLPGQIASVRSALPDAAAPTAPVGGGQPTTPVTVPDPSLAPLPDQSAQPSATAPSTPPTATPSPVTPKPSTTVSTPPTSATEASGSGDAGTADTAGPAGPDVP